MKRYLFIFILVLIFLLRYNFYEEPKREQEIIFAIRIRNSVRERLQEVFPEPHAGIASGLLLGTREAIPRNILEDFRRTGLTHILALSGYNIILVISFVSVFVRMLPRGFAFFITIGFTLAFVLLTGASPSVVRAAIMGSLGLLGNFLGKSAQSYRVLFITGYIMSLINPELPLRNLSFQLSFMATLGILLLAEPPKKRLAYLPRTFAEIIAVSFAAQIGTLPVVTLVFRGFSLIALIANIFILPLIPPIMLFSFLGLLFGKIAAAPAWLLIEIVIFITHFFADLPFAYFDFGIS